MDELEGGDITADHMVLPELEASEILNFYNNSTVFLTGATGFLGKLFLEKLLRTCELKRIYILIRPKQEKDVKTRFEEIFDPPCFDVLKRKRPEFHELVTLLPGDCALPNLGLTNQDREIVAKCDVIIHCAATVRFDQNLKTAAYINVRSVLDLISIAKTNKNLKVMIHVSTAFSNCPRPKIEEKLYNPPIKYDKLLALLDCLDDATLAKTTPHILGRYPNTYVFTKAVAEDLIHMEGRRLPVVVYRPAIVIASFKEPVAGWIDNFYGATGVLVGAALGLLRSLYGDKYQTAELVPADYVINCGLAAGWEVAKSRTLSPNKENSQEAEVAVYNFVSSPEQRITWDDFTKLSEKHCPPVATEKLVWAYFFAIRSSKTCHNLAVFFYQTLPAYIVDFLAGCLGKEPVMVRGYQKLDKFMNVISNFTTNKWIFTNDNVQALWKKMNPRDKDLFEFSMENFNWDSYWYTYARGLRVYLLKDPLDTVARGQVKYWKMQAAHYGLISVLLLIFLFLLFRLISFLF